MDLGAGHVHLPFIAPFYGGHIDWEVTISKPFFTKLVALAVALLTLGAAGCGSSGSSKPAAQTPTRSALPQRARVISYHPKIVAARFTANITNRYFPIARGKTFIYAGTKDGAPERVEMKILHTTRTILGVPCVVISDVVTSNYTLVEKTTDWYSQDSAGNVWYFGEDTKEYKNGVVTSTAGTWEAGVDNAQPGIAMKAAPKPGPAYRQEYRPGIAEDMAKILTTTATRRVPLGKLHNVLQTYDTDPLNPNKLEHKWFAPGVGMIEAIRWGGGHNEHIKLVKVIRG